MSKWSEIFLTGVIGLGVITILVLLGLLVWSVVVPTGTYEEDYADEIDWSYCRGDLLEGPCPDLEYQVTLQDGTVMSVVAYKGEVVNGVLWFSGVSSIDDKVGLCDEYYLAPGRWRSIMSSEE